MPELNSLSDELTSDFFDRPFNEGLVHQAVVTHQANQRVDLASAKSRGSVSGRNKKPWRQKGTGRSRHGSRISPLWVGGGRAHAPDGNQDHSRDLTEKMKHRALSGALSVRRKENSLYRLKTDDLEEPSTATMDEFFREQNLHERKLLLLHTPNEDRILLSTRNLSYCDPFDARSLNTFQVVAHDDLLFTEDGLEAFMTRIEN